MNTINSINSGYTSPIDAQYAAIRQTAIPDKETVKPATFKDVMTEFLRPANETDFQDKLSNAEIMLGDVDNVHSAVIAGEYADIAIKLTAAVRNRVVDAYNEIMRMQM